MRPFTLSALCLVLRATAAHAQVEPDSYDVYSVVLDSLRSRGLDSIWVEPRTVPLAPVSGWRRSLEANRNLPSAFADDLLARGAVAHPLEPAWATANSTARPDPLDVRAVTRQWRVTFSPVGFTPDRTQALVYVSQECGRRCGGSSYVWLRRHGEVWKIVQWLPQARF